MAIRSKASLRLGLAGESSDVGYTNRRLWYWFIDSEIRSICAIFFLVNKKWCII